MLTRVAVGDHILLGGDNMDLALAHAMAQKFAEPRHQARPGPDADALAQLPGRPRKRLFAEPGLTSTPVTVLGRGSKVIGGTIKGELSPRRGREGAGRRLLPRVPVGRRADAAAGGRPAGAGPALRRRPGGHQAPGPVPAPQCRGLAERAARRGKKKRPARGRAVQRRRLQGRAVAAAHRVEC